MEKVIIPISMGIVVDDVGWHDGADGRAQNMPARSGLPRFHHPDDVRALNEIGKKLNTRIVCSLVLGEWDRNNFLRGAEGIVPNPDTWDQASIIDLEYTKEYFNALEESEYLDYSLHGLMHATYDNGKLNTARQYYPNVYDDGKIVGHIWQTPEKFEEMIDLFYKIYDDWGFKKKITQFVSPCGCWGTPKSEGNIAYAKILRKRGIKYWSNSWSEYKQRTGFIEGIITAKGGTITAWNAYDNDPDYLVPIIDEKPELPLYPYCCGHLTNFIRFNYQKNFEYVDKWVKYFKKYTDRFGLAPARSVDEACSQMLYADFARLSEDANIYTFDLNEVDATGALGLYDEFLITVSGDEAPKLLTEGAEIELYDKQDGHTTYKIVRGGNKIIKIKLSK